ncbi:MAG: hypothetical protein ACE37J_09095 [Pikeienuella sp.]|uniref:hypothetical protein n=1 Tax=Pikeienuella sp. TaxID=2831957 RepID=UPI003919E249
MPPAFPIGAAAALFAFAPAANEFDRSPDFAAADEIAALRSLDEFRGRSPLPDRGEFQDADPICDLGDETISAIVYQRPAAELLARGASMPEVKVLSGDCTGGALSGPFGALILREAEPSEAPVVEVVTYIEGAMENGALSGVVLSSGSRYESENWGAFPAYFSFRRATYSAGVLGGVFIAQDFVPVVEGGFVRRTMTLRSGATPGAQEQRRYTGARLDAAVTFVNGAPEGTAHFPSRESGPTTVCYSGGALVKEEAC